ncbi:MAG: hypothetical protein ACHQ7M_16100 [Chloroflexota bacterium]
MATKTDTIEYRTCDLCGHEMNKDQLITLYRTDNKIAGARFAAAAKLASQAGQNNVDICIECRKRPVDDVLDLMYPTRS